LERGRKTLHDGHDGKERKGYIERKLEDERGRTATYVM